VIEILKIIIDIVILVEEDIIVEEKWSCEE